MENGFLHSQKMINRIRFYFDKLYDVCESLLLLTCYKVVLLQK